MSENTKDIIRVSASQIFSITSYLIPSCSRQGCLRDHPKDITYGLEIISLDKKPRGYYYELFCRISLHEIRDLCIILLPYTKHTSSIDSTEEATIAMISMLNRALSKK